MITSSPPHRTLHRASPTARRLLALVRLGCCLSLLLAGAAPAQTFFTDVTEEVGLDLFPGRQARNIVFVDYDNDGFQDVFITRLWPFWQADTDECAP